MQDNISNTHAVSASIENAEPEVIAKRIKFYKNTLRSLVTMAAHEYFDSNLKQDEMISSMLDKIINSYSKEYWNKLQK